MARAAAKIGMGLRQWKKDGEEMNERSEEKNMNLRSEKKKMNLRSEEKSISRKEN